MTPSTIALSADPSAAAAELLALSASKPVFVFKKSPICPVSTAAEGEFGAFVAGAQAGDFEVAMIDVIAQKPLARGLTAELKVQHQSPQALLFAGGQLRWNDSHGALTREAFAEALAGAS